MSSNLVQRVQGDPGAFTVTPGVAIGAIVADETGAVPGASIVLATSPTARQAFPLVLGGAGSADLIEVAATSPGAGVRRLTWTITTAAGAPRAEVGVVLSLACNGECRRVEDREGAVVVVGTSNVWSVTGQASAAGVLEVDVTAPVGAQVNWILTDLSSSPGSAQGTTVIP